MRLSDICLSVAYIEPKSRTERPRKTKIGKEVAHVTRDSDTTFKVKVTRPLCSPPCWRIRRLQQWAWNVLAVGNCCYVAVCSSAQGALAPTGKERGGGISWRPPAHRLVKLRWSPEQKSQLKWANQSINCILCHGGINLWCCVYVYVGCCTACQHVDCCLRHSFIQSLILLVKCAMLLCQVKSMMFHGRRLFKASVTVS